MSRVLLVSNFEGGYPPVSVTFAATELLEAGHEVTVLDTYVEGIRDELFPEPDLVAISIPLFDALWPGIEIANRVREANPDAYITFFGQYATINQTRLAGKYGDSCVVGESEATLAALAARNGGGHAECIPGLAERNGSGDVQAIPPSRPRSGFRRPTRDLLPPLHKYPQAKVDEVLGGKQVVGAIELTRGCHHRCTYCSVFAAYDGKVVVMPQEILLDDVRDQVERGMTHLSFVDAEFFNTRKHGLRLLRLLHAGFPDLTYDFTTRVDHLIENRETMAEFRELGVRFITSALEFPSQEVLDEINKEVTVMDLETAIRIVRDAGIEINPTFIMFNPWISLEDLATFGVFVERNDLGAVIDPIQFETRLHLYRGSPLLSSASIQALRLVEEEFHYEWEHPDPRVDELFHEISTPPEPGVFKRCCLKC